MSRPWEVAGFQWEAESEISVSLCVVRPIPLLPHLVSFGSNIAPARKQGRLRLRHAPPYLPLPKAHALHGAAGDCTLGVAVAYVS